MNGQLYPVTQLAKALHWNRSAAGSIRGPIVYSCIFRSCSSIVSIYKTSKALNNFHYIRLSNVVYETIILSTVYVYSVGEIEEMCTCK